MLITIFNVSTEIFIDFAAILVENDLDNRIVGTTMDGVNIEVRYSPYNLRTIYKLEKLISTIEELED
jgi:hypothetical protein